MDQRALCAKYSIFPRHSILVAHLVEYEDDHYPTRIRIIQHSYVRLGEYRLVSKALAERRESSLQLMNIFTHHVCRTRNIDATEIMKRSHGQLCSFALKLLSTGDRVWSGHFPRVLKEFFVLQAAVNAFLEIETGVTGKHLERLTSLSLHDLTRHLLENLFRS